MIPGSTSIFSFNSLHRENNIFNVNKPSNGQDNFNVSKPLKDTSDRKDDVFDILVEYSPGKFKTVSVSKVLYTNDLFVRTMIQKIFLKISVSNSKIIRLKMA